MRLPLLLLAPAIMTMSPTVSLTSQQPGVTTLIIVQGNDTVSLEQYARVGQTVTGVWINHQNGPFQVHDYVMTLGAGGMPTHYEMTVSFPDGAGHVAPPGVKYVMDFGSDSVTLATGVGTPVMQHIAMKGGAYPTFGTSLVGQDLALAGLRAAHADSGAIAFTTLGLNRASSPFLLPIKFIGPDSATLGSAHVKVDNEGHLLGWRTAAGGEGRRVAPIDVKSYVASILAADAAAETAARAAAHLVTLPVAALDRLVGEYALNATIHMIVARDHDKLTLRVGNQPPADLLTASATKVFVGRVTSGRVIEFETDAAGNATALLVPQFDGTKQRAPKAGK